MLVGASTVFGGDFRVVEQLGAGGMGEVYVTEQLSTGKRRALKVMTTAIVTDGRDGAGPVDALRHPGPRMGCRVAEVRPSAGGSPVFSPRIGAVLAWPA